MLRRRPFAQDRHHQPARGSEANGVRCADFPLQLTPTAKRRSFPVPQNLHNLYARRATLFLCCHRLAWHDEPHGFALWSRSKNLETQIFWFLAIVTCVLAFGFEFKHKSLLTGTGHASRPELVRSQEKDNWLICIVVLSVILVDSPPYGQLLRGPGLTRSRVGCLEDRPARANPAPLGPNPRALLFTLGASKWR